MAYRGSRTYGACAALLLLTAHLAAEEAEAVPVEAQAPEEATPSTDLETPRKEEAGGSAEATGKDEAAPSVETEGGVDEICRIDPAACPTLDMKREAAKPLREPLYASVQSLRERTDSRIVVPAGVVEVGGEVAFVTGQSPLTDKRLAFTDLALLRLAARRSILDSLELDLGGNFAIKQPTESDEPVYQGVTVGARLEFAEGLAAALSGAHAPLIQSDGNAWIVEEGFVFKQHVHRYLRFRLGGGGAVTILNHEDAATRPFWLEEALGRGEAQFGDKNAAFWVGVDYRVPIASSPDRDRPDQEHGYLNPQTGIGLEIGGVVSARHEGWDVYAVYRVIDRGDAERPETELPLLDGGYDQTQFVFGVRHQFGEPTLR